MSLKTTPTTRKRVLLALASLALAALAVIGIGAQSGGAREPNFHSIQGRGDIKFLPAPLQNRLLELAQRPHSYLPLTVFSEADSPSQLFGYYLLDTTAAFQVLGGDFRSRSTPGGCRSLPRGRPSRL